MEVIAHVAYRSEYGEAPPAGFGFKFSSLYGLNDIEKANIAASVSSAVVAIEATGAVNKSTILRELKKSGEITGYFTTITDDDIANAEASEALPAEADPPAPSLTEASDDEGENPVSAPGSSKPDNEPEEPWDRTPFPLARPKLVRAAS